jgi:hypothetical protein
MPAPHGRFFIGSPVGTIEQVNNTTALKQIVCGKKKKLEGNQFERELI